jgi:hypothetical protein
MKRKRSRIALVGVLALALSVTVGLVSGSVADAKKKKGGGNGRSFTVAKTAPTVVPQAPSPTGATVAKIPIGVVGGKATKGKVISLNGVNLTTTFAGSPGFVGGANGGVSAQLVGPSGRTAVVANPFGNGVNTETSSGPLTETPNSSLDVCVPDTPAPPPPCADPDAIVGPPYIGTIGNEGLLNFVGSGPRGTWFIKVANLGPSPITVGAVTVTGGLILKPLS